MAWGARPGLKRLTLGDLGTKPGEAKWPGEPVQAREAFKASSGG